MECTSPSTAERRGPNVGLRETRQISRIVVDPKNADVVYVGALGHAYGPNPERGVYKSTDGGKTWAHVLDQGPEIGVSDSGDGDGKSGDAVRGYVAGASAAVEYVRAD